LLKELDGRDESELAGTVGCSARDEFHLKMSFQVMSRTGIGDGPLHKRRSLTSRFDSETATTRALQTSIPKQRQ
jgi:hypothetical protein